MRYVFFAMACCALGFGSIAKAEDRAATDQLPAALQAMDVSSDNLVTEDEAREVRGTYYYGWQQPLVWNYGYSGNGSSTIEYTGTYYDGYGDFRVTVYNLYDSSGFRTGGGYFGHYVDAYGNPNSEMISYPY